MVYTFFITLMLALPSVLQAAGNTSVTLYQIGSKGKYCLSLSRDESGCISGQDGGGNPINIVDITRGKEVRFENLSDAPHDMKISGANKENLPAQGPGAAPVEKTMAQEDRNKEKITCSFHGDQLGVGYRVLDDTAAAKTGQGEHRNRRNDLPAGTEPSAGDIDPTRAIRNTGLADVGREVMAKGKPEDVAKLLEARPELMKDLKEVRPLLADEIAAKMVGADGVAEASGAVAASDANALAAQEAATAAAAVFAGSEVLLDSNGNPILSGSKAEGAETIAATGGQAAMGKNKLSTSGQETEYNEVLAGTKSLTSGAAAASILTATRSVLRHHDQSRRLASVGEVTGSLVGPTQTVRGFFGKNDAGKFKTLKRMALVLIFGVALRGFYLLMFAKRNRKTNKAVVRS